MLRHDGKIRKTKKVLVKDWQKLYGKAISAKFPGFLKSELKRKFKSAGGQFITFSTQKKLPSDKLISMMRTVSIQRDRFMLNGRPYYLRLVLDQGYWPDTLMTPPSDEALRRDVELVKAMGFNGVRKHQKIEDPRFLYWADVLGLLVWEEMPSAYRFSPKAVERITREWTNDALPEEKAKELQAVNVNLQMPISA